MQSADELDERPGTGRAAGSVSRIVVAADDSPGGRNAVEAGIEVARAAGAVAIIVYVCRAPFSLAGDAYYERAFAVEVERGRDAVEAAAAHAAEAGVETETEILEGDPAELILRLARLRDADLIVIGTRGLSSIARVVIGSVSTAVVHGADRPVLVVTPRAGRGLRAA